MAKLIRRKVMRRRKLKKTGVVTLLFTFALMFSFVTKIFVHTNTAHMNREIAKAELVLREQTQEREKLLREVTALKDYAIITDKASEFGMTHDVSSLHFTKEYSNNSN